MNNDHRSIKRIEVCHGPTCGPAGGERIKMILENELAEQGVAVIERGCCGNCEKHNNIMVDGVLVQKLTPTTVREQFLNRIDAALDQAQGEAVERDNELMKFLDSDLI